ncbi:MAG TPA: formyltetrahydrofolate deformylase [Solirubrobacterales bacterium]|nr:formyltetrahydrofolate deformylase [Solirubrobacterales bacterium]
MSISAETTRLLLSCPDRPGIIARVAGFLAAAERNILDADQHSNAEGRLFMRLVFEAAPTAERAELYRRFAAEVAEPLEMEFRFAETQRGQRLAVMASREDHCLLDLLWRCSSGELEAEPLLVISNHPDHREAVESFEVPYHHIPVAPDDRGQAEEQALELLAGEVDLLVLARYMQVLSGSFLERLAVPAINIHHSFLPAFAGAEPYERAWQRGVKLIGATAHYVTEELDAGPIIEQDTARVSHRDEVGDLIRLGRDLERVVLARAVRAHIEDRVIVDGPRTLVF